MSFGSILRVAEDLNDKELQSLEIAVLYSKIPDEIKKEIVSPYISVEKDEARVSIRIKDSLEDLRRNDLIDKINIELKGLVPLIVGWSPHGWLVEDLEKKETYQMSLF